MGNEIKGMKILHWAMCYGALIILLCFHFAIEPFDFDPRGKEMNTPALIGLVIAFISIIVSSLIFKRHVSVIGTDQLTSENIEQYKSAYTLKWALLEGPLLINALLYVFLSNHPINIIVAILLLLLLYLSKPKFY